MNTDRPVVRSMSVYYSQSYKKWIACGRTPGGIVIHAQLKGVTDQAAADLAAVAALDLQEA